jgi:uncharacterized membrane protein
MDRGGRPASAEFDMQNSIFIARLLGPAFVVVSIAIAMEPRSFRAILSEFIKSEALTYLAGFLGLLGGLTLVLTHNIWSLDWRVIITLIGWITIFRALVTIFVPQIIARIGSWYLDHGGAFFVNASLMLVIGAVLCYFGYRS